jgi:hypothetical protein
MFRVSLLAAHEHGDAVMRARNDQLVAQRPQPHHTESAQTISQHNSFYVRPRVHGVEIFLQRGAKLVWPVMQTHLEKTRLHNVVRAARMKRNLLLKHVAGQQRDLRRSDRGFFHGNRIAHDFLFERRRRGALAGSKNFGEAAHIFCR